VANKLISRPTDQFHGQQINFTANKQFHDQQTISRPTNQLSRPANQFHDHQINFHGQQINFMAKHIPLKKYVCEGGS